MKRYVMSIVFHSIPYNIFLASKGDEELKLEDTATTSAIGTTNYSQGWIAISDILDDVRTRRVVIHELTHAIIACTQPFFYWQEPPVVGEEFICEMMAMFLDEISEMADTICEKIAARKEIERLASNEKK